MTRTRSDWVIQTDNLTKFYGRTRAVTDLSLTVPKNSIFAFLGRNGAGKSTTVKLLLGLIRPSSGGGTILGYDMVTESIQLRRRVGYLAQDYRFYRRMTVGQTLRFVAGFFYRGPQRLIEGRVQESLELVGLVDKLDCPVGQLSGGERQRLGIAQAQINNPELLILDEPTASLDPMGRKAVLDIMNRLRERTTVLYSTHILSDVQRVADGVAILDHGRLVTQADVGELLEHGAGSVYSMTIKGDPNRAVSMLQRLPWVISVQVRMQPSDAVLQIQVSDDQEAEARLLRTVLADTSVIVTGFGLQAPELEDIFIHLVGGEDDGKQ